MQRFLALAALFAAAPLAQVLVRSVEVVGRALTDLRNSRDVAKVQANCVEIHRLENESDQIHRHAIAQLFKNGRDPFQVMKWKEILENIETATDRCEDVANVIEGVMLKNA